MKSFWLKIAGLGVLFAVFGGANVFGQKTFKTLSKTAKKSAAPVLTPQRQLENAVIKSQKFGKLRVMFETLIQNQQILSTFEHLSPDKFYLLEKVSGKITKEVIETARQRFQKKDGQWIKTRVDYFPLREQLGLFFPIKLTSGKGDRIKVKKAEVKLLGEDFLDQKKCWKYSYTVSYNGFEIIDAGIAWVNQESGLLEHLETDGAGLLGRTKVVWNYFYDIDLKIDAPKDFLEKDWID